METRYEHIVLNEDVAPSTVGTTTKVVELNCWNHCENWAATSSGVSQSHKGRGART